jgi:hypothetical protein
VGNPQFAEVAGEKTRLVPRVGDQDFLFQLPVRHVDQEEFGTMPEVRRNLIPFYSYRNPQTAFTSI